MEFGKHRLIIIGLCVVLILLVWGWLNANVQLSEFKNQISQFEVKEQKFLIEQGKSGETITSQKQLILSQKDALALQVLELGRLKKVKAQIKYTTKIVIDSVFVPFTDTLLVSDTVFPSGIISVPKRFDLFNPHYSLNGLIELNGVLIDSLRIKNELRITIGNKTNGLFKKSTPVVDIINSNPYIVSEKLNNVIIQEKKKWWQKNGTWLGVGVGLGMFTIIMVER